MKDRITTGGIVLDMAPQGENNRRLTLLSDTLGRVSVFANGSRRENSPLSAASQRFAMGQFTLARGFSAWQLESARLSETFWGLSADLEKMCLASYFADLAGYFTRENLAAKDELNLLYVTFRTLLREDADLISVRAAYMLKLLDVEGVGMDMEKTAGIRPASTAAAVRYILTSSIGAVYGFRLEPEGRDMLLRIAREEMSKQVDVELKSLAILESIM